MPILTWAIVPLLSLFLAVNYTQMAITLSASLVIFSSVWWQLNKLEQKFYRGTEIPPRNTLGK